jgi:mono/diheme cytochrome c family protein
MRCPDLGVVFLVLIGCAPSAPPSLRADHASALVSLPAAAWTFGDPARGAAVAARFQCNRCHAGLPGPAAAVNQQCAGCHRAILDGSAPYPVNLMAAWRRDIRHYTLIPSLTVTGPRPKRGFVARFLASPVRIRPALEETMPRLLLTEDDIRNLAALLGEAEPSVESDHGDAERGREIFDARGCGRCHGEDSAAPDLAFARDRWYGPDLRAKIIAETSPELFADDADDVAAYLGTLSPVRHPARERQRLPILDRQVRFDEVLEKVLRTSCWHCHSEPDYALGDGGPGNTGGFGFLGRRVVVATWEGVNAGYWDGRVRRSMLVSQDKRPALLLDALLSRVDEEAGRSDGALLGMPLGLPAFSDEQIQLLETWVAQGARP